MVFLFASLGGFAARASAQGYIDARRQSKPRLVVSPRRLNLGKKVSALTTAQFSIQAVNGTIAVAVAQPTGRGAQAFSIVSGGGKTTLKPGETLIVSVLFDPPRKCAFSAKIRITYDYGVARKADRFVYVFKKKKVRLHGSAVAPAPSPGISGAVLTGTTPVAGSSVTLYAAGASGFGSAPAVLGSATTSSDGSFLIPSGFTCPINNPQTYVVATGGDAGSGNNPAAAMMALAGPCNNLSKTLTFVTVNELTTAAAQWALAQFTDSTGQSIGAPSTDAAGLDNSANEAMFNLVASPGTSTADSGVPASFLPSTAQCSSTSPPANCDALERLDTFANIMAGCVQSTGPSAVLPSCASATTACDILFACTGTPADGTMLQAAHAIATNPTSNLSQIFAAQPSSPPFEPSLSSVPSDFALALNLNVFNLNTIDFLEPFGVAIDAAGNVWVANSQGSTVAEVTLSHGLAGTTYNSVGDSLFPTGIAIDASGNVWVTNYDGESISELIGAAAPVKTPIVACLERLPASTVCTP